MKRCPYTRKVKYGSAADAFGWASDYLTRSNQPPAFLRVYQCPDCSSFHLTRMVNPPVGSQDAKRTRLQDITSVFWEKEYQRKNVGNRSSIRVEGKKTVLESALIEIVVSQLMTDAAKDEVLQHAVARATKRRSTEDTDAIFKKTDTDMGSMLYMHDGSCTPSALYDIEGDIYAG